MKNIFRVFLVATLNMIVSVPLYATQIEQKDLNFEVKAQNLIKGDLHFSFRMISPKKLAKTFPDFLELDSLNLNKAPDSKLAISKAAFIVNKPIGFFDHKHMIDERYISHIYGEKSTQQVNENTFEISDKDFNNSYTLKTYFDSDDITTLAHPRAIRSVTASKKMDVMVQSAPATVLTESTEFKKYYNGAVTVTSYVSLKENKTIVIVYKITNIQNKFAKKNVMKAVGLYELNNMMKKIESFR